MEIRTATPADWPLIWPFLREIVAAGETYTWPRDVPEERARELWMPGPPARTVVAVAPDGTVLGSAKLLIETGEHPGRLKDMVTSPGGTAIAGLHTLEAGGLRTTLINAVESATARSRELGEILREKLKR